MVVAAWARTLMRAMPAALPDGERTPDRAALTVEWRERAVAGVSEREDVTRFVFTTEPGRIVKCTGPSSSTATTRTTAVPDS